MEQAEQEKQMAAEAEQKCQEVEAEVEQEKQMAAEAEQKCQEVEVEVEQPPEQYSAPAC